MAKISIKNFSRAIAGQQGFVPAKAWKVLKDAKIFKYSKEVSKNQARQGVNALKKAGLRGDFAPDASTVISRAESMDNKEAEAALTEKRQRMARAYIAEDIYREQLARESANRPTNDYDPRSTLGKFEREVTEKKQPRPADKAKLGHELAYNRTS